MIEDKYRRNRIGYLTLIAHAATHGLLLGALAYFLGLPAAFMIGWTIFVTHALIDFGKIRGIYGVMTDQALHWIVLALIVWISRLS